MKHKSMARTLALALGAALLAGLLGAPALAEDDQTVPQGNQMEGHWVYEVTSPMMGGPGGPGGPPPGGMPGGDMGPMPGGDPGMGGPGGPGGMDPFMMGASEPTATLLWGDGAEKEENVVMIPAELGGYPVTTVGSGAQNISANNKTSSVFVLFPEGVTTLSPRMIYDYNTARGWSIPESVTAIDEGSFLSCTGAFYGVEGSPAQTLADADYARDFITFDSDGSLTFTAEAGENGWMQPNGVYHLPSRMLEGDQKTTFHIEADYQYKIASMTVDGQSVLDAPGKHSYDLEYSFTFFASGISVTFEPDPNDDRDPASLGQSFQYEAPEIYSYAVAEGAVLPPDVNEYLGVHTGSTAKYENTMGISTGAYYAAEGKLYKMTRSYQSTDEAQYMSKAEAINGVYDRSGLVYGRDYDLIRVYNYYENVTSGPARGIVELYCTYLYREIQPDEVESPNTVDTDRINTASLFVQKGADLTLTDFTSKCYTAGKGPSEAGNFFGMGSAIHVDGGDVTTPATTYINTATAALTLINPQILGPVNSVYAAARGVIDIEGGNIFSCSSGGHGPYVSTGGDILINVQGTDLIGSDGLVNRVTAQLTAAARPEKDLGTMHRDGYGRMVGDFDEHPENVTAIITGDEAGTALATDSGGGVIVANQVSTKTFGLRCAGVYSIGSNESWVYCYNSNLTSYLDAGLCSASGGYIFAYNCNIEGVMGVKCRAGGNADSEETGVHVNNSRVAAHFDAEGMAEAYDVGDAETMRRKLDSGEINLDNIGVGYSQLNIFLDKANNPKFYEDSLDWWFTDRSKTPGYSGGNKFAVMYVENSSTPIFVDSSLLVNQNYIENGDPSQLEEGMIPADNLLLSVEGAGAATVHFKNENAETPWDLTGVSDETTELTGDFYLGAYSQGGGGPDVGMGPNSADLYFENSQWTGTVRYGDTEEITGVCNLTFDQNSSWNITADTRVANLDIWNVENITADQPVTVTFDSTSTVVAGTYGNVTLEGPGVDEWPEPPEPEPEPEIVEEEPASALETEAPAATPAPTAAPQEPASEVTEAPAPAAGSLSGTVYAVIAAAAAALVAVIAAVVLKKKKKD